MDNNNSNNHSNSITITDNNNNNNNNTTPPHSSSADSSSSSSINTTNTNNRDQFLRHLNKLSHKISKPPNSSINTSSSNHFKKPQVEVQPPPPPPPPPPPQQQQPPVYNINKCDFRDVVQKLTGSPAHAASASASSQPPIHAPKPASSRLQRIRPPPLVQLSTRPPPLLNCAVNPHSPLPPLPTCHAAAESPISAYMRFLHGSVPTVDGSFNRAAQMLPPPPPSSAADSSGFGWLPSPKSPCPLLSPNLIFSPTGNGSLGFPQLPASPTMSGVPSPK